MSIAEVISWKFNDQPGMRCKEIDGVMEIVDFPGGIPTKEQQAAWTKEYIDAGGQESVEKERMASEALQDKKFKAFVLALNDGSFIPGSNYSPGNIVKILKAKM